ncbi:MAG: hypothetical protein HC819_00840 [Cyclobacteriaceae bacterium]|nr:hypothetical protein [Cyclobacteriaceae bacterium]
MSPRQKNISIIHNCEQHFSEWLKCRLSEKGIADYDYDNLTEVLRHHEKTLGEIRQHIKPLLKWNKIKDECYLLSTKLNGSADSDEYTMSLMEKTAFEGQVLWLTLQQD